MKPTSASSHTSPHDRLIRYEEEEKKKRKGILSAKDLREVKETARIRLQKEIEAEEESGIVCLSRNYFDLQK